jgi:hypothetical protein
MENHFGNYQNDHQHQSNKLILSKSFIELSLHHMQFYCVKFSIFHIQTILELKIEENKSQSKLQRSRYNHLYPAINWQSKWRLKLITIKKIKKNRNKSLKSKCRAKWKMKTPYSISSEELYKKQKNWASKLK